MVAGYSSGSGHLISAGRERFVFSVWKARVRMSECYGELKTTTPMESLPDAISQVCAAIDKLDDAQMSAICHLHTAIMQMVSCLEGWEPNGFQKVEVDIALDTMRLLVPSRFISEGDDAR